MNTNGEVSVI